MGDKINIVPFVHLSGFKWFVMAVSGFPFFSLKLFITSTECQELERFGGHSVGRPSPAPLPCYAVFDLCISTGLTGSLLLNANWLTDQRSGRQTDCLIGEAIEKINT